jgi:hypothetical protein
MRLSPHDRAVRYRRLALAEPNPETAKLLYLIANEAERGVLVTADWTTRPGDKRPGERYSTFTAS